MLSGISQLAIATSILIGGTQVLEGTGPEYWRIDLVYPISEYGDHAIGIDGCCRSVLAARRHIGRTHFEVYDGVADILDKPAARVLTPEEIKGKIVFDNVTFAFRRPDGKLDPPALKNINLTIEPGEHRYFRRYRLRKSAMVNLIPRFYDVTEGKITIDGIDVRDIQQESLRRIVGVGLQEAVLFQGDIRFNLKFGAPDVDDEVMRNAAKAADSYGFVSNLPESGKRRLQDVATTSLVANANVCR